MTKWSPPFLKEKYFKNFIQKTYDKKKRLPNIFMRIVPPKKYCQSTTYWQNIFNEIPIPTLKYTMSFYFAGELVVIVEYCKYGNLHDFLLKQRNNFINQIDAEGHLDFSITDLNK